MGVEHESVLRKGFRSFLCLVSNIVGEVNCALFDRLVCVTSDNA